MRTSLLLTLIGATSITYGELIPPHDHQSHQVHQTSSMEDYSTTPYEGSHWKASLEHIYHGNGIQQHLTINIYDHEDGADDVNGNIDDHPSSWLPLGDPVNATYILQLHNTRRATHQVPPLIWNQDAANYAQSRVNQCRFELSGNRKYGENMAMGYTSWDQVMKAWADDEEPKYNFEHGDFDTSTGAFTQVVWKSTSSVGCGLRQCLNGAFYSCNYEAPGNIRGQYQQNVFPPKTNPSIIMATQI
ncbi:CAP domain-containing protein [Halteromyces radiatus]|uniref:CAP domain-containing protein n=1 Tax=Halteromyces radiatus TaxID=101107 RepID=UPI00221EC432|nr:CAP domain-containing protein [Halteromyces radiatus]KAI8084976.1 CAP domain-containing protein [Halteromyces radiatus]